MDLHTSGGIRVIEMSGGAVDINCQIEISLVLQVERNYFGNPSGSTRSQSIVRIAAETIGGEGNGTVVKTLSSTRHVNRVNRLEILNVLTCVRIHVDIRSIQRIRCKDIESPGS